MSVVLAPFARVLPVHVSSRSIFRISTLGWDGDAVAKRYMELIVLRVEIILKRRKWRVGHLKEFYPRTDRLLGLNCNHGEEIRLLFRSRENSNVFLPFEQVLHTTLHELAHIRISRHNKAFYQLLDELVEECEKLELELLDGGAILYPWQKPGEDAETRARMSTAVLNRLSRGNQTREVCPDFAPGEEEVADADTAGWTCDRCSFRNSPLVIECEMCSEEEVSRAMLASLRQYEQERNGWRCGRCTYINEGDHTQCEMCLSEKYTVVSDNH
ncbi:WLM domain/Protein of unknown function DUF45/Zn-finger in Ran binding protein and others, putative [Angomonas deanei]|uniref:WLM domain containing protein n=1 Tax=Angomonas deanei TaxID=59799 RepID=A0A7G2CBJ7_9TRYP|nr:WLM domain/Protein of unknown function DUF45/Zn-finger in Ran binding protein and others, putative [Angomonas deanei]